MSVSCVRVLCNPSVPSSSCATDRWLARPMFMWHLSTNGMLSFMFRVH